MVSGTGTSTVTTLSPNDTRYGLESIEWAEGGINGGLDRPCHLQAVFRDLNDPFIGETGVHTRSDSVNVCNDDDYRRDSLRAVILRFSHEQFSTGEHQSWHLFGNQLTTCDSDQSGNDRIKGISLWGMSPFGVAAPDPEAFECTSESGGAVVSGPCTAAEVWNRTVERTNCGAWSTPAVCPVGMVASALKVHSDGNEIVGLALECDTVLSSNQLF